MTTDDSGPTAPPKTAPSPDVPEVTRSSPPGAPSVTETSARAPGDAEEGIAGRTTMAVGVEEPSGRIPRVRRGTGQSQGLIRSHHDRFPPAIRARYEPSRVLGEGGMGIVLEAWDQQMGRVVALKGLRDPSRVGPAERERQVLEAQITAGLSHPNILQVYDRWSDEAGNPWVSMMRVPGAAPSLQQMLGDLSAAGRVEDRPLEQLLDLFVQICRAIAYAHEHGVLHRDLKPANVLLGTEGEALVADWGIAVRLEDLPKQAGVIAGTPAYGSPEQMGKLEGASLDTRSDIYSLGVILHEMVVGRTPAPRGPGKDAPPIELPHRLPRELKVILGKATAWRPEDRYPAVTDLIRAVLLYRSGGLQEGLHYTPRERLLKRMRSHPTASAVTLITTCFLALAAYGELLRPGRLSLDIDAPGATVTSEGERWSLATQPWSLRPGTYALEVSAPGHERTTVEVQVDAGGTHERKILLPYPAGFLALDSEPPGSRVSVRAAGSATREPPLAVMSTPFTTELAAGRYDLLVEQDGYQGKMLESVEVRPNRRLTQLPVVLEKDVGWLRVGTLGAVMALRLTQGGREVFTDLLPMKEARELRPGRYGLHVSGPLHPSIERSISISRHVTSVIELWTPTQGQWLEHDSGAGVNAPPVDMDLDGRGFPELAHGTHDGRVVVVSLGSQKTEWTTQCGAPIEAPLGVGNLGSGPRRDLVAATMAGRVVALSGASRATMWERSLDEPITAAPAMIPAGPGSPTTAVVVATHGGRVAALAARDGTILWEYRAGGKVHATPVVAALGSDGSLAVVIASYDRRLTVLDAAGGRVVWSLEYPGGFNATPLVLTDEAGKDLVVGSEDRRLRRVSGADGTIRWERAVGETVRGSPAAGDLDGDGDVEIVAATTAGEVVAVRASDGQVVWSRHLPGPLLAAPVLGWIDPHDGLDVVVGTIGPGQMGHMYALAGVDGRVVLDHDVGAPVMGPALLLDRNVDARHDIFYTNWLGRLTGVMTDLDDVLWVRDLGARIGADPAYLVEDGREERVVVAGTETGNLEAVEGRTGRTRWRAHLPGRIQATRPAGRVDADTVDDVIVVTDTGRLEARSGRDGELLWTTEAGGEIQGCVAGPAGAGAPALLLVGSSAGRLQAIQTATGRIAWEVPLREPGGAPWVGDLDGDGEDEVIVGSRRGAVQVHRLADGDLLWKKEVGADLVSAPVVGEIDDRPGLDILFQTYENVVILLRGTSGEGIWSSGSRSVRRIGSLGESHSLAATPCWREGTGGDRWIAVGRDGALQFLRGRDGSLLHEIPWSFEIFGLSPEDLDGSPPGDLMVNTETRLYGFSGQDPTPLLDVNVGSRTRCRPAFLPAGDDPASRTMITVRNGSGLVASRMAWPARPAPALPVKDFQEARHFPPLPR